MKIATWNVKNFFDAGVYDDYNGKIFVSEVFTQERIGYFAEVIAKVDPDILFLQEVQAEKALTELAKRLDYHFFQAKKDHRGIANTVLYKKSTENITVRTVSLPPVTLPALVEGGVTTSPLVLRRELVGVTFPYQGKKVSCFGVHLKSALPLFLEGERHDNPQHLKDALARAVMHKMGEMIAIRTLCDGLIAGNEEVIIAGDFNESTSSLLFSLLKRSPREVSVMTDVLACTSLDVTTHLYKKQKLTFDTILMSVWLAGQVVSVEVLNKNLEDMSDLPLDNDKAASDHALVLVEIV